MHRPQSQNHLQYLGHLRTHERPANAVSVSLGAAEYGYYFVILYTTLGGVLGLTLIGGIGGGFLLIPVLGLCILSLGPLLLYAIQLAWVPLACGISYLFIQLVVHGEPLYGDYKYAFVPWMLSLIIVQSLTAFRPNFLHRFAFITLAIGLTSLPFSYLSFEGRLGVEGVSFGNSNAVGGWFGFCALYLTIRGYCEKRPVYRLTAWLMGASSLLIVGLTVSRSPLLSIAASLLVAIRKFLKRGLLPLLLLAVLLMVLVQLGVFDQVINAYTERGTRDSGRLQVWPILIERFINSPFIGDGASNAGAFTEPNIYRTPHNSFLLFAVASGIVPLLLFIAYCLRSILASLRANSTDQDHLYYLPLVVYTILIACSGNVEFMQPWAVVSLSAPLVANKKRPPNPSRNGVALAL
jgi:hypothetical protein